jgi:hypothetical protein
VKLKSVVREHLAETLGKVRPTPQSPQPSCVTAGQQCQLLWLGAKSIVA